MNNLIVKQTRYTMGINFNKDTGILEMIGSSYPEHSVDFFGPIIKWVREFVDSENIPVTMNICLNYLNTSSTKCILDIFEMLDVYHREKSPVIINWNYSKKDEDIRETGEEMAEDFEFQINFIDF